MFCSRSDLACNFNLEELQAEALSQAAKMFKADPAKIRDLLIRAHHHDWTCDPFSRGAYSYTPVGMASMAAQLAIPIKNTLFFAGEATDSTGEEGTVQAALESGCRAARQMLAALERDARKPAAPPFAGAA